MAVTVLLVLNVAKKNRQCCLCTPVCFYVFVPLKVKNGSFVCCCMAFYGRG